MEISQNDSLHLLLLKYMNWSTYADFHITINRNYKLELID